MPQLKGPSLIKTKKKKENTPEIDKRNNTNSKWVQRREGSSDKSPLRYFSASKERPDSAAKWVTNKWKVNPSN